MNVLTMKNSSTRADKTGLEHILSNSGCFSILHCILNDWMHNHIGPRAFRKYKKDESKCLSLLHRLLSFSLSYSL